MLTKASPGILDAQSLRRILRFMLSRIFISIHHIAS
jgi:hypothetical protein